MSARLRVLLCIDALGLGGKERQAVELTKGLTARLDIECRLICLSSEDFYFRELLAADIPVDVVPRLARWDVGLFRRLYRIARRFRPDIIHTNGLLSSFYALPLARIWRVPLVNGSIRNAFDDVGFRWRLEKWLLQLSDSRIANSRAGLESRGFSTGDGKSAVIYNGFDFTRLRRVVTTSEETGRGSAREQVVGMVAEFNRYKDYATLIKAARIICSTRPRVVFLLAGDGPTLRISQDMAAGVPGIRFLGRVTDVETVISACDIGVLCTFGEGLSNSIMEYMAFAKPVIATDAGGTRELVSDGVTGFLVPPADAAAVQTKLEELLDRPDIARQMGAAGEQRLSRDFTIARMVDETVRVYWRAVTGGRCRNEQRVG